jgi:uncharacterized surface protein with fasciclin (FAS1) repeats
MLNKKMFLSFFGIVLLLGLFAGCESDNAIMGPSDNGFGEMAKVGNAQRSPAPGSASIAEIVVASAEADQPQFTLLLGALEYTGLTGVFTGGEQYTVFAPTDQAFLNLVESLSESLNSEILTNDGPFVAIDDLLGEGTVTNVLLYHVTEGRRAANSVVPPRGLRKITTLLGATFTVNSNGVITDLAGQEANIVAPNISASNGIIHVIDTVILPLN